MLDAKARRWLSGIAHFLGSAVGRLRIHPNVVTVAGVAVVGVAAWQVVQRNFLLAGVALAFGGCLDFVDGAVAKATGKTSELGGLLDSVTDRLSDGLLFGALVWVLVSDGRPGAAFAAVCSLVLGQLVSYVRAKAEALGYECKVGLLERAERTILIVAGLLFSPLFVPALVAVAGLSAVTAVQRVVHVARQMNSRRPGAPV